MPGAAHRSTAEEKVCPSEPQCRTHRIGQKNVVNVMRLVTKDTIEERIVELQQKKAALADSVIEGKGDRGE